MAAGQTYTAIASQTLGSDSATITFSSIPATYTDLVLVMKASTTAGAGANIIFTFNSDTSSVTGYTRGYGDGTTKGTDSSSSYIGVGIVGYNAATSAQTVIANIPQYANTSINKTVITYSGDATTGGYVAMYASGWRSTAAINRIDITSGSGNYRSGCIFTLYGIAAA